MMKKQAGFTLVELMIVIAIIGVLTAVAILAYDGFMAKSDRSRDCVMTLPEMARDQEKYKQINRVYADTFAKLNTVSRVGITWAATPAETTNTHTYTVTTANSNKTFLLTCTPTKKDAVTNLDASDCGALTYDNFGRKGGVGATGTPLTFPGGKPVEICWR